MGGTMIPTEGVIKGHEQYVQGELNLNDEWNVDVDVRPYLMTDLFYEIHPKEKRVEILVYSARYPSTWQQHIGNAIEKMKSGFSHLIEDGKIENPFLEE